MYVHVSLLEQCLGYLFLHNITLIFLHILFLYKFFKRIYNDILTVSIISYIFNLIDSILHELKWESSLCTYPRHCNLRYLQS